MDIAPTLTMYRGTNQEFATKYQWWFFLIQADPLPEHMIGLDPKFYLQHIFEGLNKTPGAIAIEVMNEYVRAFSSPDAIHASCEDFRAAAGIDLEMDKADDEEGRRSTVHFMLCGAQKERSAHCGTCWLLGGRNAPRR
jgi:haloacetate dehalogenase